MRRRHLLRPDVSYLLSWCGLMSVRLDEMVHDLDSMNCPECRAAMIASWFCPACGSKGLEWGVAGTEFYLGCPGCSETLTPAVGMDTVAARLTENKEVW